MNRIALSMSVLGLLCLGASVAAADVWWSSAASGCTLDSTTTANAVVNSATGAVSFAAGKTGLIYLTCPVTVIAPSNLTGCSDMDLTSTDQDNPPGTFGLNYATSAILISQRIGTGVNSTLATINNSNMKSTVDDIQVAAPSSYDFGSYVYFVQLGLYRANTAQNPVLYSVTLSGAPIC